LKGGRRIPYRAPNRRACSARHTGGTPTAIFSNFRRSWIQIIPCR
jgi:hypothetical protein